MYHFAQLKFDNRGHVAYVDLIRQTEEHRDGRLVKVLDPIETWDTLTGAMARARVLNEETA